MTLRVIPTVKGKVFSMRQGITGQGFTTHGSETVTLGLSLATSPTQAATESGRHCYSF